MALSPTAAFGKKKTSSTTTTTLPAPTLVNQATPVNQAPPPLSAAGGAGGAGGAGAVDPVTGRRGPVRGGAPPPVTTPTGGPIGLPDKVNPDTPAPNMPTEVIIKEGVYEPPGSKDTSNGGPMPGDDGVMDLGNIAGNRGTSGYFDAGGTKKKDTSDEALDNALRALNLSRIQGASNVDTTEAEDLIRELMQRQLGAQQVGQRASMGRAGFGSSGALAAMEGDAQQQAALGAQREILDLRRTEDQRAFDNAQDAAGTDIDYRRFGLDDEIRRAQLKALQDYLGLDAGNALLTEPQTGRLSEDGTSIVSDEDAVAGSPDIPVRSAKTAGSQPMGDMTGDDGNIYDIFYDPDKEEVYVVRRK